MSEYNSNREPLVDAVTIIKELRTKLADKERELAKAEKKIYEAHLDNRLAQGKLATANAVMKAYDLVVSDFNTTGRCTNLRRENLRNKLSEWRKLQGGDGDE